MLLKLKQIVAIGVNTFRQAVRKKMLYAVALFVLVALSATGVFGALSLHQEERIFFDLNLLGATVFLVALSMYYAASSVQNEIETGTAFTVISKPVSRTVFVLGKYAGIVLTSVVGLAVVVGVKTMAAALLDFDVGSNLFIAYYGVLLQLLVVVAVAVFFSSFTSAGLLTGMFTFGIFVAGSLTPQIDEAARHFAENDNPTQYVLETALFVLPDFHKMNFSFELAHGITVPTEYFVQLTAYSGLYAAIVLTVSAMQFERRDLS